MTILSTGVATEFISFTRASNATVTDSNGLIDWAAHNLLLASEQFDSASWTKSALTVTANNASAPNGTTTAELAVPNTTSTQHSVAQTVTLETGTSLVAGLFVKASGYSKISLFDNAAGNRWVSYSLSGAGSILASAASATGSITALANGWYFISMAEAAGASAMAFTVFVLDDAYTNASPLSYSYAGNGTSGVLIWGAHLYRSDLGMQANTSAYPMYNPTTAKNLLGFTENFDNAGWTKANIAAFGSGSIANAVLAPNGLQTADLIAENTGTGLHSAYQTFSCIANTTYVFSAYVKPAGRSIVRLSPQGTATLHIVEFNLTGAGTATTRSGSGTAAITALSDGWYRISTITAATGSGTGYWQFDLCNAANSANYTGDGVSGVYLWGAQLSDSASLDPYSPNHFAAPSAAAYYGPRRDFDPVTLACKGLLVEEQRTNALQYSEEFTNAYWIRSLAPTITADTAISPSGAQTADTIAVSGGVFSGVYKHITSTNGTTYTSSVYVKAGTLSYVCILVDAGSSAAWFNLSNGTKGSTAGTIASYNIVPVGNGWYRVWVTFVANSTANATLWIAPTSADNINNGTGSVYAWGAQIEQASFATSYIPTTTASATRSADVAQVSTAAFPYSATEGSFVVAFQTADPGVGMIGDQTGVSAILYANNRDVLTFNASTSVATANVWTLNTVSKAATAYDATGRAVCLNAGTVATGSGSLQTVTSMDIGRAFLATSLNGHIRQLTYIPRRLSNAELQTRTA